MERLGKRERVFKVAEAPGLPFDHATFDIVVEDMPSAAEKEKP